MNSHPPHHHDPQPTSGFDPTATDLVPGDPPVPITVWRTARSGDDQSTTIGARLASRLVTAYSRPGDAVIDLTDGHVLADACRRGYRRHHQARFTNTDAVIIAAASPTDADQPATPAGDDDAQTSGLAWFGDSLTADLTDDLPPHDDAPAPPVRGTATVAGPTSLVVAGWPLDAADAANRDRLGWLLTAARRLLRPGGCLVLVVAGGIGTAPQDFTPLVGAARVAGLGYLQHIVAVRADVDGDRFTYYATDEELLALAHARCGQLAMLHLPVQADLLVFIPLGTSAGSARLTDSQAEPEGSSRVSRYREAGGSR